MKSKLIKKLILITTLGIFLFGLTVSVQGAQTERKRPIEDWLAPVVRSPLGGMPYWDKGLVIWTFLDDPTIPHWDSALDYDPEGFVIEKELKNNIMLITVNMRVKDAPFYILTLSGSIPTATQIFYGVMDFTYQLKFTIDLDTLGPDDYDEDGNIIYHPWDYYVWELRTLVSVFLCGHGSGEFLNSYDGWEEGDTAKMNTINFIVVAGEDYTGSNPYYNILGLFEIVLVDNINFH